MDDLIFVVINCSFRILLMCFSAQNWIFEFTGQNQIKTEKFTGLKKSFTSLGTEDWYSSWELLFVVYINQYQ
jgi:hypothetical protein